MFREEPKGYFIEFQKSKAASSFFLISAASASVLSPWPKR